MPIDPEVELDGKTYRRIGEIWYDATSFIRAPKVIARKLDVRLRATMPEEVRKKKKSSRSSSSSKKRTFTHKQAFPLIAEVIRERHDEEGEYVPHKEIVAGMLDHPEGGELIEEAADEQGNSVRWVAGNKVAWFSKRMTEERSPYQDDFERERINGAWAYRPA